MAQTAYSYLRFSTPEQSKGDSLRRQTALAEDYAKQHGLTLDKELNLRDLGVSAFRGDNAALGALGAFRRAISDGLVPRGSTLLVESLDRVSRQRARAAVRLLEEIVEAGVTVVTLNDGKAYTEASLDGTDFLMAILLFMRSHEESATKAKRLKAAWGAKRARAATGEIQTTRVPAWIQTTGSAAKDARNATLKLHPDRVLLVERMFQMFLDGNGKAAIAQKLNDEKVSTWGAGQGRTRARYWHGTYVFKILTNPAVTGRFTPYTEEYVAGRMRREAQPSVEGYYPSVIDDETFGRVQTLITARTRTVRSASVASLVAGLGRCPLCGSTMTRIMKGTGTRGGVPKLICVKAKARAGCTYRLVKLADVENALTGNAEPLIAGMPMADTGLQEEIAGLDDELYRVGQEVERLVDALAESDRPSRAVAKRLEASEARAAELSEALTAARAKAAQTESKLVQRRAERLRDALIGYGTGIVDAPQANAAMRECFTHAVVDYRTGELALHWRHGGTSSLVFSWPHS